MQKKSYRRNYEFKCIQYNKLKSKLDSLQVIKLNTNQNDTEPIPRKKYDYEFLYLQKLEEIKEIKNKISNKLKLIRTMKKRKTHQTKTIVNRGTGAGGLGTNKNGLSYERLTNLRNEYIVKSTNNTHSIIQFKIIDRQFIFTKQTKLFKYMKDKMNSLVYKAHGCKNPDECFIDENNKNMFIIEKKFQQGRGSVCEKIQTPDFKLWQYGRTFPTYTIIYIYCLSDWFKENCKAELKYLRYKNIPIFWGNDRDYTTKLVRFILDYQ